MITKLITVTVKPSHWNDYCASQGVWNSETRDAPGYLGCVCGRDPRHPDTAYVLAFWQSRADLDRWMAKDHDRIAALAGADAHYERIEVRILHDVLPPDVQAVQCRLS